MEWLHLLFCCIYPYLAKISLSPINKGVNDFAFLLAQEWNKRQIDSPYTLMKPWLLNGAIYGKKKHVIIMRYLPV